jgi:GNAT superfamily N-acetyltransferase
MFTIVPAQPGHISNLNKLIEESVKKLSINYYTDAQINSALKYVFGVDTQLIHDGTYYLVMSGNDLAGCGGWSKRDTLYGGDQAKAQEDPLLDPVIHPARIRAFFVHPNWARKGVGSALLNYCADEAIKSGFKSLQLAATLPGVPFYVKLGFELQEDSEAMLPDGEILKLCIMKKQIDQVVF